VLPPSAVLKSWLVPSAVLTFTLPQLIGVTAAP
jgi:hypothetical protein